MATGIRCPFCGELGGMRDNCKRINVIETYITYKCNVASCKRTWTAREVIIGAAAKRLKQSKSRKVSKRISKPIVASQDGAPHQSRKPGGAPERRFLAETRKMSIGALLQSGPTWKKATLKEKETAK